MIDERINQQLENQIIKALNRSALIICVGRMVALFVYAYMHLWGLMGDAILGVLLWAWIYGTTNKGHLKLAFTLGTIELGVFCVFSTVVLGWNCGAYFSLVILLPIILINGKLKKNLRTFLCVLTTLLLVMLYLTSSILKFGMNVLLTYQNFLFSVNLIQGCIILILINYTVEAVKVSSQEEIVQANKQLLTLANLDPLTNLMNRRIMMTRIEEEKERVDRGGALFSLIMIDVDNFKQINDEYGHDGGDFVLVTLAEKIKLGLRKKDLVSRWGGDEFLIVLPETELSNCTIVAEKIRSRIVNAPFIYHEINIPVTITLGISECDKNNGIVGCIRKADLSLYDGKQNGKNRVGQIVD